MSATLPLFLERSAEESGAARQQVRLRYQWARDDLRWAREAFGSGDLAAACAHLVHAEEMRGSARWWRTPPRCDWGLTPEGSR